MIRRRPVGADERGSVLVDALVAIAVISVALAMAARTVSETSRRLAATEDSRLALLEARSRLAEVGGDIPLEVGVTTGEDDGLAWRVEVEPTSDLSSTAGRLLDVTVTATGARGLGHAELQSRRFGGA